MSQAEFNSIAEDVRAVLADERAAISRLDGESIGRLAERKEVLIGSLREHLADVHEREGAALLMTRLRAEAEANALLMRDALDILRGLVPETTHAGTYDARGTVAGRGPKVTARRI